MNQLWQITIEDYLKVVRRAKAIGIKTGESMEPVFRDYLKEKGLKPLGHTELTIDELKTEMESHGKKVLIRKDLDDLSK